MSGVAVLCPTRDRPDGLYRLANSVSTTSDSATVIACGDEDTRHLYDETRTDIRWHFVDRMVPAKKANYLVKTEREFEVYGVIPDDAFILSPNWDVWVLDTIRKMPGRIGVVSAMHNGEAVNFPFVSREWIDALGWLACPRMENYCWDTVLQILGESTELVYADQRFMVQHDNPVSESILPFANDCMKFMYWVIRDRHEDLGKLFSAKGSPNGL